MQVAVGVEAGAVLGEVCVGVGVEVAGAEVELVGVGVEVAGAEVELVGAGVEVAVGGAEVGGGVGCTWWRPA